MDELLLMGRTVLAAQPFSRLLGAELIAFRPGEAELALTIRPDLLQQHGFVHGGVIAYLTDNALTFAGGSVLGPAVVTSEFKINYLKPAREGRLVARATVVAPGARQAVCRAMSGLSPKKVRPCAPQPRGPSPCYPNHGQTVDQIPRSNCQHDLLKRYATQPFQLFVLLVVPVIVFH